MSRSTLGTKESPEEAPGDEALPGGALLSVPGWSGAAVRTGVKPSGGLDLALLRADVDQNAAGVFTRNALPAAPVMLARRTLAESPRVRAVAINAGNANAMTGARGDEDARALQRRVEEACGGRALVLSTGVIGVPLPVEKVERGIDEARARLARDCPEVAEAILTTDTVRKTAARRLRLPATAGVGAREVTVGGLAKGSGMIHPNMATMLAVVATDVPVEAEVLDGILRRSTDRSFHEISVDGDTSTNDAVLLLAPAEGEDIIGTRDPRRAPLEASITAVMQQLARAVVEDGEGRTRVMELWVREARDGSEARAVATAVAGSSLVKTALAGGDPNWGRILAAAANAGVPLDPRRLSLDLGGHRVFEAGRPLPVDPAPLNAAFGAEHVVVELCLGRGQAAARRWTTDLSHEYVRINSEYTT